MDAPLADRLAAFAEEVSRVAPEFTVIVENMVRRLKSAGAGDSAPAVGDMMPTFVLPDEQGRLVSLAALLENATTVVAFHRGHWCPYCRINTRALAEAQGLIASEGGQIVAIMPDREKFAAALKVEGNARYRVLTDIDNGYALSVNLAVWIGDEMNEMLAAGGRKVPVYQGNDAWFFPIPATFVVGPDGRVAARFIDPDYRRRMAIDDLVAALRNAQAPGRGA